MAALLMSVGGQSAMAQAQKQQQLNKKSFSPKMLVYENLKNNNVLRHKIWSAIRYMNYAPIEASSNFFKNLANSLAKIEE